MRRAVHAVDVGNPRLKDEGSQKVPQGTKLVDSIPHV
jgi:hypothetical protein